MLLVLERFLQQSWHTMIQPNSLWLAPRVLTASPPFPHSTHVPMFYRVSGCQLGYGVNDL